MKRAFCVYLPFLATDRLRSLPAESGATHGLLATLTAHGQALRVVHLNAAAYEAGVRRGQTLAEAKAMVPELVTFDDDPAADRRQLEDLAVWMTSFSPVVQPEGDDTLLADVTGCERLFRGEGTLLRKAVEGLAAMGFQVRAAIADTPGAAWACAHAHPQPAVVVPGGRSVEHLAALPVWSLRIEPKAVEALAGVGVLTVESLLHLPRSSVASRFGEGVLLRIDQALGDRPELLRAYEPRPAISSTFPLGAPATRQDVVRVAIHQALTSLCERLSRQMLGVRRLFATFRCAVAQEDRASKIENSRQVTLPVSVSRPTRSVTYLESLLRVLLDKERLPGPTDCVTLWAKDVEPLQEEQGELFSSEQEEVKAIGPLLDRLIMRLGPHAVLQAELVSDHQPERAVRYRPVLIGERRGPSESAARGSRSVHDPADRDERRLPTRPLFLADQPIEIAATSLVPDGPPITFVCHGTRHTVVDCVGPERIETGWWRGPHVQRDYYRVSTDRGRRCWLFRERMAGTWFLHGWFD